MDIKPTIGCSYIGKTPIYRIVRSEHDYTPMCFHRHETDVEALACEEANAKYAALIAPKDAE